ncbi:hypothetical protein N7535_006824 [Penicillium sp. DV-2018c]|nr:hypothetical protein N7535_006824 [Penicillium sp. DV-2018c]
MSRGQAAELPHFARSRGPIGFITWPPGAGPFQTTTRQLPGDQLRSSNPVPRELAHSSRHLGGLPPSKQRACSGQVAEMHCQLPGDHLLSNDPVPRELAFLTTSRLRGSSRGTTDGQTTTSPGSWPISRASRRPAPSKRGLAGQAVKMLHRHVA